MKKIKIILVFFYEPLIRSPSQSHHNNKNISPSINTPHHLKPLPLEYITLLLRLENSLQTPFIISSSTAYHHHTPPMSKLFPHPHNHCKRPSSYILASTQQPHNNNLQLTSKPPPYFVVCLFHNNYLTTGFHHKHHTSSISLFLTRFRLPPIPLPLSTTIFLEQQMYPFFFNSNVISIFISGQQHFIFILW